jgi:DNA-binding transcriptional MocR family regulator
VDARDNLRRRVLIDAGNRVLTPPKRAGLLLGYAGLDESRIREGIERLARVARLRT